MFFFLLLSSIFLFGGLTHAQTVSLTFTGKDTANNYVQLDSVMITNVTKNWQETIYWPDTMLIMQSSTSIEENAVTPFSLMPNNPNPFRGTTNVTLMLPEKGVVSMEISDVNGRIVTRWQTKSLHAGTHKFHVSLSNSGVYVMTARQNDKISSIKMLCEGGFSNSIDYVGEENTPTSYLKLKKSTTTQSFNYGDEMEYIGYATINSAILISRQRIKQYQTSLDTIIIKFTIDRRSRPTVQTTSVSNITDATATSGGNVTSDGGAAVTARGVCWSTSQNPTINDNHTTDGTGEGSFTSNLTGLSPNTTYYVRAYATNVVGTAYGNEITFTTKEALFSVSATEKVYFSPGNLQWSAKNGGSTATTHAVAGGGTAAGTWRFAPNQWDAIGANNSNISSTYSGWIDLFGFGTSGYNNKHPYMTSGNNSDYGNGSNSISGTNYDWGVYNAIYNPKTNTTDAAGTWRTLTYNEWIYLIGTRTTTSGIRYAKATVNGINGLIIVPDNWRTSIYALNSTNISDAAYSTNVISATNWTTLENAGAVFLPATGYRNETSIQYVTSGYYSHPDVAVIVNTIYRSILFIGNDLNNGQYKLSIETACAVRLVREAE